MDTSKAYKLMCYKAKEIQDKWQPKVGDCMVALASYCSDNKCNDENICPRCLDMDNTYVISVQSDYHESIGGTHWFYGGGACVKGHGHIMNDTHQYVLTKDGSCAISNAYCSSIDKMLWLPRQDQIQKSMLRGYSDTEKSVLFYKWLEAETGYLTNSHSLEMLWLMFYMKKIHGKVWANPFSSDWSLK